MNGGSPVPLQACGESLLVRAGPAVPLARRAKHREGTVGDFSLNKDRAHARSRIYLVILRKSRFDEISNPYHLLEAGWYRLRV